MPFQLLLCSGVAPSADLAAQAAFDRMARTTRVRSGDEIFAQESGATGYYRVARGVVRSIRLFADGRRQVSEFYFPGDMFGLALGVTHSHAAEALTDCEIQHVRRQALATSIDRALVERLIWAVTSQQLEQTQARMVILARYNAYEKVAFFLAQIARRSEGTWASLPMCRQDIADYLGLTIETVSRMLTQLQHDGVVALDGSRRFTLTRARLPATGLAA